MSPKAAIRIERIVKKGRDYLVHYSEKEGSDDAGKVSAILLDEEQMVSYRILKDKEYDSATWRKIEKEAGEIVGYKRPSVYQLSGSDRTRNTNICAPTI